MTTIKRTSLADQIKYSGRIYTPDMKLSAMVQMREKTLLAIKQEKRAQKISVIKVEVLNTELKGRTDLRGNNYQPTVWIYTAPYQSTENQ